MTCYRPSSDQPRMIHGRHASDCPGRCDGCEPCSARHCLCGRHLTEVSHPITCPACVGETRDALDRIVYLTGQPLVGELLNRPPGSEASHLVGPAADPEQWRQRGRHGHHYDPDAMLGETHPEWVLGSWDLLVTEELGHDRRERVSIRGSAAYLGRHLTLLAQREDFAFEQLRAELGACVHHLETVLHASDAPERGAPCPRCGKALTQQQDRLLLPTGYWECRRCHQVHTAAQYALIAGRWHVTTADRLCAADLAERLQVPASTVRRWASVRRRTSPPVRVDGVMVPGVTTEFPPLLRSVGTDPYGRRVYRVAAAEALAQRRRCGSVSTEGVA